ncbi:MAG: KH domain-containing protein [Solobacterium sp.]|jgi:spoIIIJ-associated protein|nr:KH domain-containing protein [Solobacterium sp.]
MNQYTGKTQEEAIAAAAADKNCKAEDLTWFVKEEKKGLLGIGGSVTVEAYCADDIKEFIFNYIGTFFTDIDQDIEVGIEERDGGYLVRLNAENNAVLIGKMGKTLAALNTVIRCAVNNEFRKRIDVLIDVNDYKEDRYRKVRALAKRTAKEVLRTHVDAALDPMPNDERKAIHRTLNDWEHITTQSEGEGRDRHICIRYSEESNPAKQDETEESSSETASEE